jgi:hypothetical protein
MTEGHESGCKINIAIHSKGDVNIYNCTCASTPPRPGTCEPEAPPGGPGACIPLALGSKPKQSQKQKIDRLLGGTTVPSTLAAGVVHLMRRFAAGHAPANALESGAFDRLRKLPDGAQRTLSCIVGQVEGLAPADRDRLFNPTLTTDPAIPLELGTLADAFIEELKKRFDIAAADEIGCTIATPGKVRVYEPQGEDFFSQVRICSVAGLRTSNWIPPLALGDYLPAEFEQICAPELHGDHVEVVCTTRTDNCPGHTREDTCFRVFDAQAGDSLIVQGVNYFSTAATIELTGRPPLTVVREVPTFVCGDAITPVSETVGGQTVLINDCRVQDKLRFTVPLDIPPGLYEFNVKVPNITGIASLGPHLTSNREFLRVNVPPEARFRIAAETLFAKEETSPKSFGSDEIGLFFLTTGLHADGSFTELQSVTTEKGDVDSGETRSLDCLLLKPEQQEGLLPLIGITTVVLGYEIDNYSTYVQQLTSYRDAFIDVLTGIWKVLIVGGIVNGAVFGFMLGGPIGALIGAAVGAALMIAILPIMAAWAPADLIAQDLYVLSMGDISMLTDGNFPSPDPQSYTSEQGIKVKVGAEEKSATDYLERREYRCDDEDSEYHVLLRYSRVT